jgi:hypothetical protein
MKGHPWPPTVQTLLCLTDYLAAIPQWFGRDGSRRRLAFTGFERSKSILDEERERGKEAPSRSSWAFGNIVAVCTTAIDTACSWRAKPCIIACLESTTAQDRGGEGHVPVGCLNKLCEVEKLGHATRWSMLLELIRAPPPRYSANSQILARLF